MKAIKSDFGSAKSTFGSLLDQEITDANNLQQRISKVKGIISNRASFSGPAYEAIINKLTEYESLVKLRVNAATTLKNANESANNSMDAYMGGYEELDTEELPALRARAQAIEALLNDPLLPSSVRAQYQALLAEIKAKIAKLEGLPGADASAWSVIETSKLTMQLFKSQNGMMIPINTSMLESLNSTLQI